MTLELRTVGLGTRRRGVCVCKFDISMGLMEQGYVNAGPSSRELAENKLKCARYSYNHTEAIVNGGMLSILSTLTT